MKELTTERYLKKIDSIYSLVILAAKRTTSLTRGSKSLLPDVEHLKPDIIALEEIAQGKIALVDQKENHAKKKS